MDFPPKGVGEMPKGTGQFVPWGKHIPRKKDVNYYVATGEQECKLCRRIVRNAEDVGRSMYSLCNGEYKELKDMCFAQQKVLQGCPEFANSTSSCGGERGASGGRAGGERGGVVGGRWYEWLLEWLWERGVLGLVSVVDCGRWVGCRTLEWKWGGSSVAVYAVGNVIVGREEREGPGAGGRKGRIEYQHKELSD